LEKFRILLYQYFLVTPQVCIKLDHVIQYFIATSVFIALFFYYEVI